MKKRFKTLFPDNSKTDVAFQGKKLSICFNINNKTEFLHKHDWAYHAKCPVEGCNDDYVGKTAKRISSEALWVKTSRPPLNKQVKSIPLKIFN